MSVPDVDVVLDELWQLFAPVARGRVEVLQAYVRSGADPALRAEAEQAAHRLAGALGSYGRSGSDQAARLELLLAGAGPRTPADTARAAELVDRLAAAVGA